MDTSFYEVADILVCDPVMANRVSTRDAIYAQGCRNIETVSSLSAFAKALEETPPDLAICEVSAGSDTLCELIRNIREGDPRYNPFTIIIATAWLTDASLTAQISNAGADSLLLRPFSAASLSERIEAHVFRPKRFVVSAHYIGPERRTAPVRESDAVVFDAPNAIKSKVEGRGHPDDTQRRLAAELASARARLLSEKSRFVHVPQNM